MKDGQMNDEMITQPLGTELLSARKQKYEIRNQKAINFSVKKMCYVYISD